MSDPRGQQPAPGQRPPSVMSDAPDPMQLNIPFRERVEALRLAMFNTEKLTAPELEERIKVVYKYLGIALPDEGQQ